MATYKIKGGIVVHKDALRKLGGETTDFGVVKLSMVGELDTRGGLNVNSKVTANAKESCYSGTQNAKRATIALAVVSAVLQSQIATLLGLLTNWISLVESFALAQFRQIPSSCKIENGVGKCDNCILLYIAYMFFVGHLYKYVTCHFLCSASNFMINHEPYLLKNFDTGRQPKCTSRYRPSSIPASLRSVWLRIVLVKSLTDRDN
jgi:hypothetical protein